MPSAAAHRGGGAARRGRTALLALVELEDSDAGVAPEAESVTRIPHEMGPARPARADLRRVGLHPAYGRNMARRLLLLQGVREKEPPPLNQRVGQGEQGLRFSLP